VRANVVCSNFQTENRKKIVRETIKKNRIKIIIIIAKAQKQLHCNSNNNDHVGNYIN